MKTKTNMKIRRAMDKYILEKEKAVLVVIDIQERLVTAMKKKDKVYENTLHLIEAAKLLNIPIVVTEQYPKASAPLLMK